MSINGKRANFALADLMAVGENIALPRPGEIIREITDVVGSWPVFARESGINQQRISELASPPLNIHFGNSFDKMHIIS